MGRHKSKLMGDHRVFQILTDLVDGLIACYDIQHGSDSFQVLLQDPIQFGRDRVAQNQGGQNTKQETDGKRSPKNPHKYRPLDYLENADR